MSRIASNLGGVFDAIWGKMMLQGDANALRRTATLQGHVHALLSALG